MHLQRRRGLIRPRRSGANGRLRTFSGRRSNPGELGGFDDGGLQNARRAEGRGSQCGQSAAGPRMGFLESRAAGAPEAPATFGDRSHCPFWMFRRAVGAGHHDEGQGTRKDMGGSRRLPAGDSVIDGARCLAR